MSSERDYAFLHVWLNLKWAVWSCDLCLVCIVTVHYTGIGGPPGWGKQNFSPKTVIVRVLQCCRVHTLFYIILRISLSCMPMCSSAVRVCRTEGEGCCAKV